MSSKQQAAGGQQPPWWAAPGYPDFATAPAGAQYLDADGVLWHKRADGGWDLSLTQTQAAALPAGSMLAPQPERLAYRDLGYVKGADGMWRLTAGGSRWHRETSALSSQGVAQQRWAALAVPLEIVACAPDDPRRCREEV
jgi:hypothetical protein